MSHRHTYRYQVWGRGARWGELLTGAGGFTNAKLAVKVAQAAASGWDVWRVLNEFDVVRHEGRVAPTTGGRA